MDVAVIGLKAHSETIKEATKDLKGMSSASKQAEAANRSREKSDIAAAGAAKANAMATKALASASGAAAFRQRQLAVQSLDVAQSLALGMPPMMVAIQQGGQLAGIYAGQGGIKGAFQEATASVMRYVRANPLLVAAGVVTAAVFSGLTYEINKTTDVSVGFGDVFMATMHVAKDAISGVLKPAIDAIAPFVQAAWDASVQYTKNKMNSMIGVAVGAYKYIMAEWSNMPAAFADISIMSANALISWAKYGANEVIGIYGDMLAKINSIVGTSFSRPGMITDDLSIPNPFAGAASSTAGVDAFRDAMNFDYLGSTFDAIRDKAVELAIAGQDAGDKLAGAAKKAIDPWKDLRKVNDEAVLQLQKAREYAADLTKGFVSDLRSGLEQGKSFWSSFGSAALNVLDKITDTLLNDVINAMFKVNNASSGLGGAGNIFSSLIGGLFGGFRASGGPVTAGKAYMVGEDGPEMIIPGASGTVIPNHALSAANNNKSDVNITVGISADNNGNLTPFVESMVVNGVQQAAPSIVSGSVKAVNSQMPNLIANYQQRNG
jgi:hypothetical protein